MTSTGSAERNQNISLAGTKEEKKTGVSTGDLVSPSNRGRDNAELGSKASCLVDVDVEGVKKGVKCAPFKFEGESAKVCKKQESPSSKYSATDGDAHSLDMETIPKKAGQGKSATLAKSETKSQSDNNSAAVANEKNSPSTPQPSVARVPAQRRRTRGLSTTYRDESDEQPPRKRQKRKRPQTRGGQGGRRQRGNASPTDNELQPSENVNSSPSAPPSPTSPNSPTQSPTALSLSPSPHPVQVEVAPLPPAHRTARPIRECRITASANKGVTAASTLSSSTTSKSSGDGAPSVGREKDTVSGRRASVQQQEAKPSTTAASRKVADSNSVPSGEAKIGEPPMQLVIPSGLEPQLEVMHRRLEFTKRVEDYLGLVEKMYFPEFMKLPKGVAHETSKQEVWEKFSTSDCGDDPCIPDKVIYELVVEDNTPQTRRPYHEAVDVEARRRELTHEVRPVTHSSLSPYIHTAATTASSSSPMSVDTNGFTPITTLEFLVSPIRKNQILDKWAPIEVAKFQAGFCSYGKKFHEISQIIGTKSPHDCIDFYYQIWKLSSRYRSWKAHRYESDYIQDCATT